jgi:hypothetical protein
MTRRLLETVRRGPGHRIGFLLEGGYDLQGVRESVQHTVDALSASPPTVASDAGSARHAAEIAAAVRVHSAYWRL